MTRRQQTSTDLGGTSTWLSEPGLYHMSIMDAGDGVGMKGTEIDGCFMLLSVLAGSIEGQEEKQKSITLWDADVVDGKVVAGQEFKLKKQTAYGVAVNQIDPSELGGEAELDFGQACIGQQILVKIGYGSKKVVNKETYKEEYVEDRTKLDLSYADIFHVDDPRAAKYPKNADALALIPADKRKPAEYFTPLQKGAPKSAPKAAAPLDLDGI